MRKSHQYSVWMHAHHQKGKALTVRNERPFALLMLPVRPTRRIKNSRLDIVVVWTLENGAINPAIVVTTYESS